MFLIFTQLSFLFLTSAGWAWWVRLLVFQERTLSARSTLLCLGAGFCLQLAPLTNLMYLDLSIRRTFWIPAMIGIAGLVHRWFRRRTTPRACPREIRELSWAGGLFAIVFLVQGGSLIYAGPFDYYGLAFQDHASYVLLAQWMLDKPYSVLAAGTEPWLLKAITSKWHRPGQSVAHAYLAAGTFGDTKEAFGTLSTFLAALFGVMTYLLARSLSMTRSAAAATALWAALSLGATKVHLFAFLSQASALFAFPALMLAIRTPGAKSWRGMILPGVFLSHIFVCYTEFFPFAVLVLVAIVVTVPAPTRIARVVLACGALAIGVLLSPMYLPHIRTFLLRQIEVAAVPNINLDKFSPYVGTLFGWAYELIHFPFLSAPYADRVIALSGYLLFVIAASAFFSSSLKRRIWLAALVAAPGLGLLVFGSSAAAPKYAFWKLQLQFQFISIFLIVLGMARLNEAVKRKWGRDASKLSWIICWAPISLGIASGLPEQLKVLRSDPLFSGLSIVQSPELRNTFAELEANPSTTYVIAEQQPLANVWLAYHARKSKAYITAPMIGDMMLHPPGFWLPTVPPDLRNAKVVTAAGVQTEAGGKIIPSIAIENPQGFDADLTKKWYWMGETMGINIVRSFVDPPQAPYELSALVSPGLGHPTMLRRIELFNSATGERKEFVVLDTGRISIPLNLAAGANKIALTLTEPTTGFLTSPQDGRKLLVRFEEIQLRYAGN